MNFGMLLFKMCLNWRLGLQCSEEKNLTMITLQAIFVLLQRAFLSQQDSQMVKQIEESARQLGSACDTCPKKEVEIASSRMVVVIKSLDKIGKMKTFEEDSRISGVPMFSCM